MLAVPKPAVTPEWPPWTPREAGTHAVLDAQIGSIRHGERELAEALTRPAATPDKLVLADRGFFSYGLWRSHLLTGVALLLRLSKTTHLPVLQVLPDGSYLSEIKSFKGPGKTRIRIDQIADPMLATHITVRVIEYQIGTGDGTTDTFRLTTTFLDPDQADALTPAAAYAHRWEFEPSLRGIECQLLEPGSTLRSKDPETVRQEIWALLLAHYAMPSFMAEAADAVDLDPDRLSAMRAIDIVHRSVTNPASILPPAHEQQRTRAINELVERLNPLRATAPTRESTRAGTDTTTRPRPRNTEPASAPPDEHAAAAQPRLTERHCGSVQSVSDAGGPWPQGSSWHRGALLT